MYANHPTPLHFDYERFIPGTSAEGGYINPATVFVYWAPIQANGQSGACTMLPGLTYPTALSGYLDVNSIGTGVFTFAPGSYHLCMLEPSVPRCASTRTSLW